MGGGSARVGFWALVLHVLFAWFYAVSCFGSSGVRYRSIMHARIELRHVGSWRVKPGEEAYSIEFCKLGTYEKFYGLADADADDDAVSSNN